MTNSGERRRRHDDAHRPMGGKGARAWRTRQYPLCGCPHIFVAAETGKCVQCGEQLHYTRNDPTAIFAAERSQWEAFYRHGGLHPDLDALIHKIAKTLA